MAFLAATRLNTGQRHLPSSLRGKKSFCLTRGSNPGTLGRNVRRCQGPIRTLSIAMHPFNPFIGLFFSESICLPGIHLTRSFTLKKSFWLTRGSNPGALGRSVWRCQGPMRIPSYPSNHLTRLSAVSSRRAFVDKRLFAHTGIEPGTSWPGGSALPGAHEDPYETLASI